MAKIPHAYYLKVKKFFNDDTEKTLIWFNTVNPLIGDVSPMKMIRMGRVEKLKKFIDTSLEENYK